MTTHDQTTPVALHRLISRLLDDHQRMNPHHAHLCPLCQDTSTALDLLAEEVPNMDCPACCAPAGEAHAETCPGKDGNCAECGATPGDEHGGYCPLLASGRIYKPAAGSSAAARPIPLGISAYRLPDGTLGGSYRAHPPFSS